MLELDAHSFLTVTNSLTEISTYIKAAQNDLRSSIHKDVGLNAEDVSEINERFPTLAAHLDILGARIASLASHEAQIMINGPDATWRKVQSSIDDVKRTMTRELTLITVLSLNSKEHSYYAPKEPLFGNDVAQKFPTEAAFEIDEAAKCIALGRPTASVFHLMRTMEIGVRATTRCLGVPDPIKGTDRNWANILEAIKAGIKAKWPNAIARMTADATLFESLHASLDAVRNPWRNATMHVESKYTDDEAEHIFIAVKGFMKKLASRCDEKGLPRA